MDFKITNSDVSTEKIYLEQTAEIPIDIDLSLSDYESNVKKILNCEITPYISEKFISGSAFSVEGEANVKIIYCNVNGELYSAEQSVPFKKSFESEKSLDGGYGEIKASSVVHSCRAITERKISMRSTLRFDAAVTMIEKKEIISDIDCDKFEQLKGETFVTLPLGITRKSFIIDEELVLPQNLPSAQRILKTSAVAHVTDCKIVADKTIVKGNLKVNVLYCSEDNEYRKYSENIPFNQIVDIPGISEFCECTATPVICGLNISARNTGENEGRKFVLICKLELKLLARCSNNLPVIYDLYSTNYKTAPKFSKVNFPKLIKQINESFICKKAIALPDAETIEVLDVWCRCGNLSTRYEPESAFLSGNIIVYIIYKNAEGIPDFFEKSIDFEYPIALEGLVNSPKCYPEVIIAETDFSSQNPNEPEIKLELVINASIYDTYSFSVITELEIDEDSVTESKASLIAYYADKGEEIWQIAKSFSAKRSELIKINHLKEDTVANPKMLLIPLM